MHLCLCPPLKALFLMKHPKTAKIKVIVTGALTLPLALLFPSVANAVEDTPAAQTNNVKPSIKLSSPQAAKTIEATLPLLNLGEGIIVVTAPATATVTFESPVVSTSPNPETIKAQELAAAIAEADKKKAQEAEEAKKAAEEEKAKAEAVIASGDVSSIEMTNFKPSGIEALSKIDDKLVSIASTGVGHPYVWGGTTPAGWDCSGFVQWTYAQAGIKIPRVNQWEAGKVTTSPVPGDIVVQNNGSHVGIYAGGGMMYSALNPSDGTKFHSVNIAPSYFVHIDR